MSISINELLLDTALGQLEQVRAWSPRVISKLETYIRTADDYALFRVNAVQYAAERGVNANEAVDLFLHATKLSLFEMEWHLICASCGHVVDSLRNMSDLHSHFKCNLCSYEATATLDDYIQVTFIVSPRIREISFHHPTSLSADDFCFKYNLCRGLIPPPGFASYNDFIRAATQFIAYVEPNEQRRIEFDVERGLVVGIDLLNNTTIDFLVDDSIVAEPQTVAVQWLEGKLKVTNRDMGPYRANFGYAVTSYEVAVKGVSEKLQVYQIAST